MNKDLLKLYFDGQATRSDAEEVLEWFQSSEGQQFLEKEIDRDIQFFDEFGDGFEDPGLNSEQLFDQIEQGNPETPVEKNINSRKSKTQWKAAAAVLLIVGVLSLFISIWADSSNDQKFVETDIGEEQTLLLPDNSKIVLHSNSSLEYSSSFGTREVILHGEAYFEVEHNKEKPFIVYIESSYVKVLGTKFVVSSYSGKERVEVAVKSGRVELGRNNSNGAIKELGALDPENSQNRPIEISENQVGVQNKKSNPFITNSTQLKELFDWVEGRMIFRDTPMKRVIAELENRFGVECVLKDPELANQKFTSSFHDESLQEVLKVLELSLGIEHNRIGNKIYFSN